MNKRFQWQPSVARGMIVGLVVVICVWRYVTYRHQLHNLPQALAGSIICVGKDGWYRIDLPGQNEVRIGDPSFVLKTDDGSLGPRRIVELINEKVSVTTDADHAWQGALPAKISEQQDENTYPIGPNSVIIELQDRWILRRTGQPDAEINKRGKEYVCPWACTGNGKLLFVTNDGGPTKKALYSLDLTSGHYDKLGYTPDNILMMKCDVGTGRTYTLDGNGVLCEISITSQNRLLCSTYSLPMPNGGWPPLDVLAILGKEWVIYATLADDREVAIVSGSGIHERYIAYNLYSHRSITLYDQSVFHKRKAQIWITK